MPSLTTKRLLPAQFINSLLWVCLFALIVSTSCTKSNQSDTEFNKDFKSIADSADHLFGKNKFEQSLHYLDSASRKISHLSPTEQLHVYSMHYVYHSKVKHNNEQALQYADSMIIAAGNISNKQRYTAALSDANFARGDALFELGRFNESYASHYKGYLLAANNLDSCTVSSYTYRMGMITYKQGNYKLSANYFKQSLKLNTSCAVDFVNFFRRQEVIDNVGLAYRNQNKLDSAAYYFDAVLQYINANADKYPERAGIIEVARAVAYGNKADVLGVREQYPEAIALLKKGIATNLKKGNDNHDAQKSEIKLAEFYLKLNEDDLVLPLLNEIRSQLDSLPAADIETKWAQLMAKFYQKKNDMAKAFAYIEKSDLIKDSLTAKSRVLKESNVNEQLGNLQKQSQIAALQNTQRIYSLAGTIFISMSLIIILLIYRNWKRSRKEMEMVSSLNKQVTQQKANLEQTLVELETSSQEKDRILRTVAHDLRNPLGGIASLTGSMSDDDELTSEQRDLFKVIRETANDSLQLINEILEATINSPATELEKQMVDINNLINNSVELMRFKAAEKNQQINLTTLDTPIKLLISREKIWRVMSNLISNAIKFSNVGSVIVVGIIEMENTVQISVRDQGIGIPDHIRESVFNMFTNAKRPGTLGEKSFGLGLSICRQIVEKHNGRLWFKSNPEGGTTFFIRLSKGDPSQKA